MEKYSVLMSVYYMDKPEYLKKSVESMLNQTIKPDEFIIVKDGKLTKILDDLIDEYANKYDRLFTIVVLKNNVGLGLALNEGLKAARNELIARMDADDISLSNRCEEQLRMFEKNENLSVIGSNISEFIHNETNCISRRVVPENNEEIVKYMKKRCPVNHVTVMFKKSKVIESGNYIEWYYNEDYYLWIRLYLNGAKFYNIQQDLVNVRIGSEMFKRRGGYKYFTSEKKIQKFMLNNKVINYITYINNVLKRFIVQIIVPNGIRSWIFKTFAREKKNA